MSYDEEMCFICGDYTGRAGRLDDSIYDDEGNGPYCVNCYDDYRDRLEDRRIRDKIWADLMRKTGVTK